MPLITLYGDKLMSFAARAYPTIQPSVEPPYLSATINGDFNPRYKNLNIPTPLEFRSTATPSLEWVDYPNGKYLRLSAGHTQNGITLSFQIVFYVKPSTTSLPITQDSELAALTYYSDPVHGTLHVGVSGTLDLQYDEAEETLAGTFNGLFDHGGQNGDKLFPINGQFFACDRKLSRW